MKKYEKPMLSVTKFDLIEEVMEAMGGSDNNDGDIVSSGTRYESYPEIDDLEMFFYG